MLRIGGSQDRTCNLSIIRRSLYSPNLSEGYITSKIVYEIFWLFLILLVIFWFFFCDFFRNYFVIFEFFVIFLFIFFSKEGVLYPLIKVFVFFSCIANIGLATTLSIWLANDHTCSGWSAGNIFHQWPSSSFSSRT